MLVQTFFKKLWDQLHYIIIPFFLIMVIIKFRDSAFLNDDNWTQWWPVIKTTFSEVLKGHIPYVNPYQLLGEEINSVGYYSVFNPFMWVSFLLSYFLLPTQDGITIYSFILLILGYICTFKLGKVYGLNNFFASILAIAYILVCPYLLRGQFWYYIFNVFFIFPAILLAYEYRNNAQYLVGCLISLSFFMGNIQFTFWITFAFASFVLLKGVLSKTTKTELIFLLKNILLALIFAFPQIWLATKWHVLVNQFQTEFFDLYVIPSEFIISTLLPRLIWQYFLPTNVLNNDGIYHASNLYFLGSLGWLFIIGILITLFKRFSHLLKRILAINVISSLLIILILIFIMFGESFLIAKVFALIPGLNSMRYIFKLTFFIPPLMIFAATVTLLKIQEFRKLYKTLCSLSITAGMIISIFAIQEGFSLVSGNFSFKIVNEISQVADLKNYRILGSLKNIDYFSDTFDLSGRFFRNSASFFKLFSVGGYQLIHPNLHSLIKPLYPFDISPYNGLQLVANDISNEVTQTIETSLMNNSVKYLVTKISSPEEDSIIKFFHQTNNIKIAKIHYINNQYNLLELSNIKPLVSNNNSHKIEFISSTDGFNFEKTSQIKETFNLQFIYSDHYSCILKTATALKDCQINNNSGYMEILVPPEEGKVIIKYHDPLVIIALILVILLTIITTFYVCKLYKNVQGINLKV